MGRVFKLAGLVMLLSLTAPGCYTRHKLEMAPVEIKPIHITIDVNVRVERALDDFFGEIDQAAQNSGATTAGEAGG